MQVFYKIAFVEQQIGFMRYMVTRTVKIFGCGLGNFELKFDNPYEERGPSTV
jgi:hypothetical protein